MSTAQSKLSYTLYRAEIYKEVPIWIKITIDRDFLKVFDVVEHNSYYPDIINYGSGN